MAKYQDALPLYRQERILKRIGVELPRATLATWMVRLGPLVQPLINLMREAVRDSVQINEVLQQQVAEGFNEIVVRNPKTKKEKTLVIPTLQNVKPVV